MTKPISKSIYLEYLECAKNAWLKLHKRHELQALLALSETEQAIADKGNLTELVVRKLFPDGILIDGTTSEMALVTQSHIEKKATTFQSTFITNGFLVKNDVLEYNPQTGKWKLYEIKAKNSLKEETNEIDHIEDATFQTIVLEACGIDLEDIFIIHLNKNYVLENELVLTELFTFTNITEKVNLRKPKTKIQMQQAQKVLSLDDEKLIDCDCIYKGRSQHCKTFKYSHPNIPEYSIHDIAYISQNKLQKLIVNKILKIENVPDNFDLSDPQTNQINSHKYQKRILNLLAIKKGMEKLSYPFYFLDYETHSHPIPLFNGFKPYQRIPFQFALYILNDPYSEPIHHEYLHENNSDPSKIIISELMRLIGPHGSIIAWNKSFEQGINRELGERHPEFKTFLQNINDRVFDLRFFFQSHEIKGQKNKEQYYVDAGFKGSTSLKKVLPILAPDCSYDELDINDGETASEKWYSMVSSNLNTTEKNKISEDLKHYCKLDTYGMYKIWLFLFKEVLKTNLIYHDDSKLESTV